MLYTRYLDELCYIAGDNITLLMQPYWRSSVVDYDYRDVEPLEDPSIQIIGAYVYLIMN